MPVLWVEIDLSGEDASGSDALDLRNALEQRIVQAGAGRIVGGGASLDGSSCDLEIDCSDEAGLEQLVSHITNEASPGHTLSFRRSGT